MTKGAGSIIVRVAKPAEYGALGELVVAAYRGLSDGDASVGYEDQLRAVAQRAVDGVVLAAVATDDGADGADGAGGKIGGDIGGEVGGKIGGDIGGKISGEPGGEPGGEMSGVGGEVSGVGGEVVGCATYVPGPESPLAEGITEGEAAVRMLGVHPTAQRQGIGEALMVACIDRARAAGRRRLVLHSTPWMASAHRLYERLGFRRAPERDWRPVPTVPLLGYVLDLDGDDD